MNLKDLAYFNDLIDLSNFKTHDEINNIINKFDSIDKFYEFMEIMKTIPVVKDVDELAKSNSNLSLFESLQSQGYFVLLNPIQKYHLFATACAYDSIDIAILIFNNEVDLEGIKGLMINYFAEVGTNTEYIMFRKIWEKNIINFNLDEKEKIFFSILKSSNLEFIEWFCSLNQINLNNYQIKNKIGTDVLANASNLQDFEVCKFICSKYKSINQDK